MSRPIPAEAIDLVCEFEGFSPKPYRCPANVLTIGFGRTEGVKEGDTTTKEAERSYVLSHLSDLDRRFEKIITTSLTDNERSALLSFVYNIGLGAFMKSTLLRKLNRGDKAGAADQLLVWTRGGGKVLPGLVRRREAERALFLKP